MALFADNVELEDGVQLEEDVQPQGGLVIVFIPFKNGAAPSSEWLQHYENIARANANTPNGIDPKHEIRGARHGLKFKVPAGKNPGSDGDPAAAFATAKEFVAGINKTLNDIAASRRVSEAQSKIAVEAMQVKAKSVYEALKKKN
jgi:hypothetical protein